MKPCVLFNFILELFVEEYTVLYCIILYFHCVQILHMFALERRLAGSNVATYAINGGAIDTVLKKNIDNPTSWGTVYNVARSLGKYMKNLIISIISNTGFGLLLVLLLCGTDIQCVLRRQ